MNDLESLISRTQRQHFRDGTTELMIGGILLGGGLALGFSPQPLFAGFTMIVIILGVSWLYERLKFRLVYPRSGFVTLRDQTGPRRLVQILIGFALGLAIVGGFLYFLLNGANNAIAWITPMMGIVIGLVLLAQSLWLKTYRLIVHGLLSVVTGIIFSPFVLGEQQTAGYIGLSLMSVYFFTLGLAFLVSGGLTLRSFVRQNPVQAETSHAQ